MINFGYIISAFFEWNWQRFKSPYVICGLIVMAIGIILLIFSNKIAYHITLKIKDADDKKLANVGLIVKGVAFVFALIGALLAVLFIS
mgnify:CR=1 FL=1